MTVGLQLLSRSIAALLSYSGASGCCIRQRPCQRHTDMGEVVVDMKQFNS